ncbi:LOW QUALITY PROTEIN: uncharacterized protein RDI95_012463 [Morus bassanus]
MAEGLAGYALHMALKLPLVPRTEGESEVKKVVGRDKDRGITYRSLSWLGWFAFDTSLSENYTSAKGASGPWAMQDYYKRQPSSLPSHPLLSPPSPWESGHCQPGGMSCCDKCQPCEPCQPCGPTPLANSCNEPCVRQCQNSTVVIQPPAVVVTLPGPILSSFPQNTVVGSSTSAAVGSILSCDGVPISSGGFDLSCITSRYCGSRRCPPC